MSLDVLEMGFKDKNSLVIHDVKSTVLLEKFCSFVVKAESTFIYKNKVVKNHTFDLTKIETIKKNNKLIYLEKC